MMARNAFPSLQLFVKLRILTPGYPSAVRWPHNNKASLEAYHQLWEYGVGSRPAL
jgi:hypothetical protein